MIEPPDWLGEVDLVTRTVHPAALWRISRHALDAPFLGRSGAHRFDDPYRQFGVSYLALSLIGAVSETLLHDRVPVRGRFYIDREAFEASRVHRYAGDPLRLADFTSPRARALGITLEASSEMPYNRTQRWSRAIHDHPGTPDGILYFSRNAMTQKAVALFERGAEKIRQQPGSVLLAQVRGHAAVLRKLGIVIDDPIKRLA